MKTYYFPRVHYSNRTPTKSDDKTKGFLIGSLFINTETGHRYKCFSNETEKAVWLKDVQGLDPKENTSYNAQSVIDENENWFFVTPQIIYPSDTIDYNFIIKRNALSVGPLKIEDGYTIEVGENGIWTIV